MARQKTKTSFLGVRYREHPTRNHGIRPDRCFFVRYKVDGTDKEEMAGWASEGVTAQNTVRDLWFNASGEMDAEGKPLEINDARQRVVFHTLRHTFASWLAQAGTPMYTLAQLIRHADMKMTQRYSHLAPADMQAATLKLQGVLEPKKTAIVTAFRNTAQYPYSH